MSFMKLRELVGKRKAMPKAGPRQVKGQKPTLANLKAARNANIVATPEGKTPNPRQVGRTPPVQPTATPKAAPTGGSKSWAALNNYKNTGDLAGSEAMLKKSMGMKKGGMVKKGYAKGGVVKANCGASVKPTQKGTKK